MKTMIFKIEGMSCNGCAQSITRALNQLTGVVNAEADWQNGTATVQFDATRLSSAQLQHAIEEAGFDVQAV